MSWRGTLILAAVVAVLAVVVLRDTTPDSAPGVALSLSGATPTEAVTTLGRLILDFDRNQIEAASFTLGSKRIDVQRDDRILQAFLDDLSGLRSLDEIPAAKANLAEYGLQPPQGSVEFKLRGGAAATLYIGDHNPSTTAVYVRFDDNGPVYVAGALVKWKFDTAFKQLATAAGDAR